MLGSRPLSGDMDGRRAGPQGRAESLRRLRPTPERREARPLREEGERGDGVSGRAGGTKALSVSRWACATLALRRKAGRDPSGSHRDQCASGPLGLAVPGKQDYPCSAAPPALLACYTAALGRLMPSRTFEGAWSKTAGSLES